MAKISTADKAKLAEALAGSALGFGIGAHIDLGYTEAQIQKRVAILLETCRTIDKKQAAKQLDVLREIANAPRAAAGSRARKTRPARRSPR